MNQPKDVEIVDYYLSAIEAVKSLTPSQTPTTEMAMQRLLGIVQRNIPWNDRGAAIRALQDACGSADPAEKQDGLILPDKDTLKALVDLGDVAEKLLGNDDAPGSKYTHMGHFDWSVFSREFSSSRFPTHSAPHGLVQLLGMMERDPYVFDIRWMAYMLATTAIETGWRFVPVEEGGHGKLGKYKDPKKPKLYGKWNVKNYYLPVKVKLLPDRLVIRRSTSSPSRECRRRSLQMLLVADLRRVEQLEAGGDLSRFAKSWDTYIASTPSTRMGARGGSSLRRQPS